MLTALDGGKAKLAELGVPYGGVEPVPLRLTAGACSGHPPGTPGLFKSHSVGYDRPP